MNVFVTDADPARAAYLLDDKRVNKMLTESVQLLTAAMRVHGVNEGVNGSPLYRLSHPHHPLTKWATDKDAWFWLFEYTKSLKSEYSNRYGKSDHLAWTKIKEWDLKKQAISAFNAEPSGVTPNFLNCASNKGKGTCFRHVKDVHLAYRLYLQSVWPLDVKSPTHYGRLIDPKLFFNNTFYVNFLGSEIK